MLSTLYCSSFIRSEARMSHMQLLYASLWESTQRSSNLFEIQFKVILSVIEYWKPLASSGRATRSLLTWLLA